jgi:GDP-4-dehydro-6-deoxy-D-mannose reductase
VVAAYHELLDKARTGETYNVCSGRAVLLADVLRELQQNCSVAVKVEVDSARLRPNEALQMFGNLGKIQSETGWRPQVPLESTLKELLAYWRTKIQADVVDASGALPESLP